MNPILSIIIPVYNLENLIEKCLKSVSKNNSNDIEIIIVDDGSIDNSCLKIKEYIENFSNMKYIFKRNGGVSSARNCGIEEAKGSFLTFLDGDDFIDEFYIESILNAIYEKNFDLMIFNYFVTYDDKEVKNRNYDSKYIENQRNYGFNWFLKCCNDSVYSQFCLNKVYKMDIIKNNSILFPIGQTVGEDFVFNIEYLEFTKSIYISNKYLYHYYQRSNSVMRTYNKNYTNDILKYPDYLIEIAQHSNYNLSKQEISCLLLKCWYGVMNQESNNLDKYDANLKVKRFLTNDFFSFQKGLFGKLTLKYKIYYIIVIMHLSFPVYKILRLLHSKERRL